MKSSKHIKSIPREEPQYVHVIINPAAGKEQPILKALNSTFQTAGIDWDIFITKKVGDGKRLAKYAIDAGANTVVVYGGDGTVMEVADGLSGSRVPMVIIPGGTANVFSLELGLPENLDEQCSLITNRDACVRLVDMGQVGENRFLIRASAGIEAAMVRGADRESKDRFGVLAYPLSAFQALADAEMARYRIEIDGQKEVVEGVACIIANAGNMGIADVSLHPAINVSDGLLDVIVIRNIDLPGLIAFMKSMVGNATDTVALKHWQAREIRIEADSRQKLQVDGEILGSTPITVKVVPHAIGVITPPLVR